MVELADVALYLEIAGIGLPILYGLFRALSKIGSLEQSVKTLNHNSQVVVRALLHKGLLHPDDVDDVSP